MRQLKDDEYFFNGHVISTESFFLQTPRKKKRENKVINFASRVHYEVALFVTFYFYSSRAWLS